MAEVPSSESDSNCLVSEVTRSAGVVIVAGSGVGVVVVSVLSAGVCAVGVGGVSGVVGVGVVLSAGVGAVGSGIFCSGVWVSVGVGSVVSGEGGISWGCGGSGVGVGGNSVSMVFSFAGWIVGSFSRSVDRSSRSWRSLPSWSMNSRIEFATLFSLFLMLSISSSEDILTHQFC